MFDLQLFLKKVEELPLTWKQKGRIVGLSGGHLQRVLNAAEHGDTTALFAMSLGKISALAEAAGIPIIGAATEAPKPLPSHIQASPQAAASPTPNWQRVDWTQEDLRKQFVEEYQSAELILTCHERLDAWLMPDSMHRWWQREYFIGLGHDEEAADRIAASHDAHRLRSLQARQHSDYRIRILAAPGTFTQAAHVSTGKKQERPGIQWLDELAEKPAPWARSPCPGVALTVASEDRWAHATKTIARRLGLLHWHKLAVIDDHTAAFWLSQETWFLTKEPGEVQRFRAVLMESMGQDDTLEELKRTIDCIKRGKW